MSRIIGNISGSDIVEEDDKSVTFLAGHSSTETARTVSSAALPVMHLKALQARHSMFSRMLAKWVTFLAS
jgi:hypothetical protein